ncbi:MAG TPA: hypothetical protein VMH87_00645 [Pseudomonadales bacterium]|nr:hypothetical protein [Pseudomonadales bacterium]
MTTPQKSKGVEGGRAGGLSEAGLKVPLKEFEGWLKFNSCFDSYHG